MAYITDAKGASLNERLFGGLAQYFAKAAEYQARRRVYRTTLAELRALSDRELNDIGMSRAMLKGVALDAARMAKVN